MNQREFKRINATFYKLENNVPAGVGCLASIIKYFGGDVSLSDLIKNCDAEKGGVSLQGLMDAARAGGFSAEGYEGEVSFLKEFYQPVILIVINDTGNESCIVLYGWQNGKFIIGEPFWGVLEYREDELEAVWKSRIFLLIRPTEVFKPSIKNDKFIPAWTGGFFKRFRK